jgi:hypothetical protein
VYLRNPIRHIPPNLTAVLCRYRYKSQPSTITLHKNGEEIGESQKITLQISRFGGLLRFMGIYLVKRFHSGEMF